MWRRGTTPPAASAFVVARGSWRQAQREQMRPLTPNALHGRQQHDNVAACVHGGNDMVAVQRAGGSGLGESTHRLRATSRQCTPAAPLRTARAATPRLPASRPPASRLPAARLPSARLSSGPSPACGLSPPGGTTCAHGESARRSVGPVAQFRATDPHAVARLALPIPVPATWDAASLDRRAVSQHARGGQAAMRASRGPGPIQAL